MSYHLKPGKLYRLKYPFSAKEVKRDGFFIENQRSFIVSHEAILLFINSPRDRMANYNPRLFDQNVFLFEKKLISFVSPIPDEYADEMFKELEPS